MNSSAEKKLAVHEGHEFGMLRRNAYLSFHRRANALILEHGVTADQFAVLTVVGRKPDITQITILERTRSASNTVASILRRRCA
jgi:hypothetical protein